MLVLYCIRLIYQCNIIDFTVNGKESLVAKNTNGNNQSQSGNSLSHVPGDKKTANRILADNVHQQMILEARQDEWRKAALVLNHICIWVFLFAVVVSFLAIFLQAPLQNSKSHEHRLSKYGINFSLRNKKNFIKNRST